MEEILTLKSLLLQGNITEALVIVEELEEMSRENKINNIRNYARTNYASHPDIQRSTQH